MASDTASTTGASWGSEEQEYMDRPPRYIDADGDVCYRASGLGLCDKALAAFAFGHTAAPPPPHMQAVFDQGHALEAEVLTGGLGAIVAGGRTPQVRFKLPVKIGSNTVHITCTLDELVESAVWVDGKGIMTQITETSSLIREAKAFGDGYWGKWKKAKGAGDAAGMNAAWVAFPHYALQVSVQMYAAEHALGVMPPLEFLVGLKNAERNGIVGWDSTIVTEPPVPFKDIKLKLMRVEAIVKRGELPETCQMTYPCPVHYLHGNVVGKEGGTKGAKGKSAGGAGENAESVEDALLDSLCREYMEVETERKKAQAIADDLDRRKKALREGIVGWFDSHGMKGKYATTQRYAIEDRVEWRNEGIIKAHERRTIVVSAVEQEADVFDLVNGKPVGKSTEAVGNGKPTGKPTARKGK